MNQTNLLRSGALRSVGSREPGLRSAGLRSAAGSAVLLSVMLMAGCNIIPPPTSDATRFFVLTDPSAPTEASGSAVGGADSGAPSSTAVAPLRIGLRSVTAATLLRSHSIVIRTGPNEVVFQDAYRWGEPIDAAVTRIVRARLVLTPSVGRLFTEPFPLEGERDYDIDIQVLRCEGSTAGPGRGSAVFSATVDITTTGANPRALLHRTFTPAPEAWDGRDYGRLAALLSDEVAAFARDLSASLPPAR